MPAPFQRLSTDEFAAVLAAFDFRRRITAVHMHHTWRPNHAQWRGHDSVVGMWRFHTVDRGFSDIAQHLTIDPQGFVWTGRNWNAAPASAVGHNGTGVAGPFMFETVGDFDIGRDVLQGPQRRAVLDVIALVQARFQLPPEALMFHNQAASKSCPGSGIAFEPFVEELRGHVVARAAEPAAGGTRSAGRKRAALPLPNSALAITELVQRTLRLIEPATASRALSEATPLEELGCVHGDEAAMLGNPGALGADSRGVAGRGAPDLTPEQIDALRPYVINLRMGRFSNDGLMSSNEADVRMIVHEHLRPAAAAAAAKGQALKIVLYAHGGLVKESLGLATAHAQVAWWRANEVYPIHFVWETGLFESIKGLLERARASGGEPGTRNIFSDWISDPLLELAVRALPADKIWGGMKAGAEIASAPGGGARVFLEALAAFVKSGAKVELHAVGHSAGSIFHAHLLKLARELGLPSFRTLQLLAPAVRVDTFRQLTQPLLGPGKGADALTVYTMRRHFERKDHCAHVYRKSLLYLVAASCENKVDTPLLGLEDSLRADRDLSALFGLGQAGAGTAEVVWSKSPLDAGRSATQATAHGDFDNDRPTMNSVLRRVLDLADADPLPGGFPESSTRGPLDPWADTVDWPPELQARAAAKPTTPLASPTSTAMTTQPKTTGRRRALCIGIDNYPTAPLSGCQNDARLWQGTLQQLGFTVELLLDATRSELFDAIERTLTSSRPGDEVVVQFAGHGTQVNDLDGDEATGDTPGRDEALCPIDFDAGALLIDDDLGALIDRFPAGARLTMFMDCCHSGSNTRAVGRPTPPPPPGATARWVRATPALNDAHRRWRQGHSASVTVPDAEHPEVLFTACRSDQVAYEVDGHGAFTLRATRVLAAGGYALSARELHQRVMDAFGANPSQQPLLDGPPVRLDAALFLP